jgi:hypothetical protein
MKTITKLTITSHLFNQSIGTLGNRIKKIPPTLIYNLNDRTVFIVQPHLYSLLPIPVLNPVLKNHFLTQANKDERVGFALQHCKFLGNCGIYRRKGFSVVLCTMATLEFTDHQTLVLRNDS